MDTSWWPAVVAAVAVAVVVLLPRRATARAAAPPPHGPAPAPRVRPGELWRLADGRTCLVLAVRAHRERVRVAWITGKYDDRRAGVIPVPPGMAGWHGRGGFLEADRPEEVSLWEFRTRVGTLDPVLWDEAKGLGGGAR
ncbi:hypothetical protein EF912_09920 [Streptomyces sp. WAC07061]|uniref:hypothetical protein n=1 Tax=Streptomyces sp. WAC07061 TaxID=2487410 RepID=UPI000F7B8BF9|nr:hypothetical protein [Streptomyces sp. WAC07061]RSS60491.1 hypothetical protein EF912_09920 [Streptomyces sp. WAC07061]